MYPYGINRRKPRPAAVALGDLLVVTGLVGVGTLHHGGTDPLRFVMVAFPFVLGWFAVAPVAGAYGVYPSIRNELFATVGAWTVSALIGLGIRSTSLFPGSSPPSFGFVMVALGGATVVLWRFVVLRALVRVVRLTR
ncbi:MAG: hypothetical protein ACI9QA_000209 [Methanobacteriota archaeon]|jgi:hypothetical protein